MKIFIKPNAKTAISCVSVGLIGVVCTKNVRVFASILPKLFYKELVVAYSINVSQMTDLVCSTMIYWVKTNKCLKSNNQKLNNGIF